MLTFFEHPHSTVTLAMPMSTLTSSATKAGVNAVLRSCVNAEKVVMIRVTKSRRLATSRKYVEWKP